MSPAESDRLIAHLRHYCGDGKGENRGKRSEVAEALGVTRGHVGDWLSGRSKPKLDVALKLRAFLDEQKGRK
jgi:transcriptional regulator with XRE-family HTH domain